jgi:hypothetical protein
MLFSPFLLILIRYFDEELRRKQRVILKTILYNVTPQVAGNLSLGIKKGISEFFNGLIFILMKHRIF